MGAGRFNINFPWGWLEKDKTPGPYEVSHIVQPVVDVKTQYPLPHRAFVATRAHPGAEIFDLIISARDLSIREHRLFYSITYEGSVAANVTTAALVQNLQGIDVELARTDYTFAEQFPLVGGTISAGGGALTRNGATPAYVDSQIDQLLVRIDVTGIVTSTVRGLLVQLPSDQPMNWPWS